MGFAGPGSDFIDGVENNLDGDSLVTPSQDTLPNQPLTSILGATAIRNQYIPIWSPGSQQQAVNTAYSGYGNEWNPNIFVAPPAWEAASPGFAYSLGPVTPGFVQPLNSALSSVDYPPVHANAIANGQLDPFLQLPDSDVYNDFGVVPNAITNGQPDPTLQLPDVGVYDDFDVVPNEFANFNSSAQLDDFTAINPQTTTTSFNQLPFPATTSMSAAPALPAHATNISAAPATYPAVHLPVANGMASRRSNVNTSPYTCNYPGCGKLITRPGDFARHKKQHGAPEHPCAVHGCSRRGSRAFYRADKLLDHQRKKHRMAI